MVRRRDNMDCQWQLVAQADMPCLIKVRLVALLGSYKSQSDNIRLEFYNGSIIEG